MAGFHYVRVCCCILAVTLPHLAVAERTFSQGVIHTIDLTVAGGGDSMQLSVAAGLINGHLSAPSVFPMLLANDKLWIQSVLHDDAFVRAETIPPEDLIRWGVDLGAIKGAIKYSKSEPWSFSNVVTLCGLQGAIPLSEEASCPSCQLAAEKLPIFSDVTGLWQDEYKASQWAFSKLFTSCQNSTSLVVLQRPELLSAGFLADFIAQRQLFAFWMPDICTPDDPAHDLYNTIVGQAYDAGQLLTIMGYFPSQEVVASCSKHHTEISLVSDFSSSLSFWSQFPPIEPVPLPQPLPQHVLYRPDTTYAAIIVSDGDNMQMAFNADRPHMDERVELCASKGPQCPPLSWTVSNRLATFAPYVLEWYFRQAAKTGLDSFLLGPSGYGFLHPTLIDASDSLLQPFVNLTVEALHMLSASAWVHWDDYNNHVHMGRSSLYQSEALAREDMRLREAAMARYIAKFQAAHVSVFSPIQPSVPSWVGDIPTFTEWIRWFGQTSTKDIAKSLNDQHKMGQLGFVYMIIDVDMAAFANLTQYLQPHVQLVGYRELIDLAHQKQDYERLHPVQNVA